MAKVKLEPSREDAWHAPGQATKSTAMALPFYKSRRGVYIHRIRCMRQHWSNGQYTHSAVDFWCGNSGLVGEKGYLLGNIPDGEVLCAACEGKAIGAGKDGARVINGRAVMFSPRK